MNDPMPETGPIEGDRAEAGDKLARTHRYAMAAMTFDLYWESENARHLDCFAANKLNLWRDIFPPQIGADLMDNTVGHVAKQDFTAGKLLAPYRDDDCLHIRMGAFNRILRKSYIEPRSGRFYPKGFIGGVQRYIP